MISISTFEAFPELPELARSYDIKLELTELIHPLHYPDEFIDTIMSLPYFRQYISAHGPFYDLIPASCDPELRELCQMKFHRAISACQKMGIMHIVFHTGWMKHFYPDNVWIEQSIQFWDAIMENCDEKSTIYLENVFEPSAHLVKDIVTGVKKRNFQICLDIGHVNVHAHGDMTNWIKELREDIGHLHLHNNFGQEDTHNGLVQGTINMQEILPLVADECAQAQWNLEIRTHFEESIAMIREYT